MEETPQSGQSDLPKADVTVDSYPNRLANQKVNIG